MSWLSKALKGGGIGSLLGGLGGPVGMGVSLLGGWLGNKESRNDRNMAENALAQQGVLAQQLMNPYNTMYSPDISGVSPYNQTINALQRQAQQGYGSAEHNAQRGAMMEATDRDYRAAQNAMNEAMAARGGAPGASSGTRLGLLENLNEQRMLNQQGTDRDLFIQGEQLKRDANNTLLNSALSMANMPATAAGIYSGQGQVAQQNANNIMDSYAGLAGMLGMQQGKSQPQTTGGYFNKSPIFDTGSLGSAQSGQAAQYGPQTQPYTSQFSYGNYNYPAPFTFGAQQQANQFSLRPPATTSTMQAPNLNSMTSNTGGTNQYPRSAPYTRSLY